MVDLHSHTDRSDGVLSPSELADLAVETRLSALGVTDHDTVEGCDDVRDYARSRGLELVYGVELAAKFNDRSIHVLGYFLHGPPGEDFRKRLDGLKASRRERNIRLVDNLQNLGLDVTLEEAQRLGRGQTGRPHFARLLVNKGYCSDYRAAFSMYLDESAPGFAPRQEASLENVFRWIRSGGGLPVWAHPGRFIRASGKKPETLFRQLADTGMLGVECYHRDHEPMESENYRVAAQKVGLGVTGGSDFHGPTPGGVPLGGMKITDRLLADLKEYSRRVLAA